MCPLPRRSAGWIEKQIEHNDSFQAAQLEPLRNWQNCTGTASKVGGSGKFMELICGGGSWQFGPLRLRAQPQVCEIEEGNSPIFL